ncbi:hypothetical protein [Dokdonella koreensis]|uniref:hypothetical protein n=1 Tax=Dokdonella koreensis TaxID=323415 RepID=UPI00082AE3AA|nr:hypothetical protein [Dokdonella koreensis]
MNPSRVPLLVTLLALAACSPPPPPAVEIPPKTLVDGQREALERAKALQGAADRHAADLERAAASGDPPAR